MKNLFNKKTNKKIEKFWKSFTNNFDLFYGAGAVIGFVLSQFVWIWVLKGFLGWFLLWFFEVTGDKLVTLSMIDAEHLFWVLYFCWFCLGIILKFVSFGVEVNKKEVKK